MSCLGVGTVRVIRGPYVLLRPVLLPRFDSPGHFDTPNIVLTSFGAIMELPFHISATCDCNGSTYYLLRRNTRQWQRLDWDGWQQNLERRLPPGFESQDGFWPRLATMSAGGELWRKG